MDRGQPAGNDKVASFGLHPSKNEETSVNGGREEKCIEEHSEEAHEEEFRLLHELEAAKAQKKEV